MTREEVVGLLDPVVNALRALLPSLPDEQSLRLNGAQQLVEQVMTSFRTLLWDAIVAYWQAWAEQHAGRCPACGRACERTPAHLKVSVREHELDVAKVRFYCRQCRQGATPLAALLDLHRGMASDRFERELSALSTEMSFHQAGAQMTEQHGQVVEAGKAERVTYRVAADALVFLGHQHDVAVARLSRSPLRKGVPTLLLTSDGGGAPVGVLHRPPREEAKEFTPVRHLPKGERAQTRREMRVIVAHPLPHEHGEERVVDVHLSVKKHAEVTGARMLAVAAMAGLGRETHVHGVFDMGLWISPQFFRVFSPYETTACVDIAHVVRKLKHAAERTWRKKSEAAEREGWMTVQVNNLRGGRWCSVVESLWKMPGKVALNASKYVETYHPFMRYQHFVARGLPIGSGEAEGAIRHQVRARYNNAGVWLEEHLGPMGALLSIRASGLWEDFWDWREFRDLAAFRARRGVESGGWSPGRALTQPRMKVREVAAAIV